MEKTTATETGGGGTSQEGGGGGASASSRVPSRAPNPRHDAAGRRGTRAVVGRGSSSSPRSESHPVTAVLTAAARLTHEADDEDDEDDEEEEVHVILLESCDQLGGHALTLEVRHGDDAIRRVTSRRSRAVRSAAARSPK